MQTPIQRAVTVVEHPLVQMKLTQLRDVHTGADEFRARVGELAVLMLFDATRDLDQAVRLVQTPLSACEGRALVRPLVVAPILRAGLGMLEGMLRLLPDVSVAHIGMFRNEETRRPESYYFKAPGNLAEADVVVVDPMLATGWSAAAAIAQLKAHGARRIRFVCLVSCSQGLAHLAQCHPEVPVFTAAVDPELNEKAYIVPGLGDAGDRYFGTTA
jgi:uracil phosphoribosyltransferase